MDTNLALKTLRQKFPWPLQRPRQTPVDWNIDAGGRRLITDIILERKVSVILEIGVFLGGSLRTWLNTSPHVVVVAMDKWSGPWWGDYARQSGYGHIAQQLDAEDGPYQTFLASNWEYRDRIIPVRRPSPDGLHELAHLGLSPDLVYLDADKSGREIPVCHQLFPEAIMTGDDWWWGRDRWWNPDAGYSIRKPVKEHCRNHQFHLKTDRHTWVIDDQPPNLKYRVRQPLTQFKALRRRARGLVHQLTGYQKRRAA